LMTIGINALKSRTSLGEMARMSLLPEVPIALFHDN